jgi:hypothetical protein
MREQNTTFLPAVADLALGWLTAVNLPRSLLKSFTGRSSTRTSNARGIIIFQNPVDEHNSAQTFLDKKLSSILSASEKSIPELLLKDFHVAYQALPYSYQARYDYLLSINAPLYIDQLLILADASHKKMYEESAGAPLVTPLADGSAFTSLTGERVELRRKESGLGFRALGGRFLFPNSTSSLGMNVASTIRKKGISGHN